MAKLGISSAEAESIEREEQRLWDEGAKEESEGTIQVDRSGGKPTKPSKGGVTDSAEDPGSDDMSEAIRHKSPGSDDMREDIRHKSRRVLILVGMGMSIEDATELEEEERHRKVRGRRRFKERVETRVEELSETSKEAEDLEKKGRRQWVVKEESEEEKGGKEPQEEHGDATVDNGSARVEGVREEDEAITRRLNISDSNLQCVPKFLRLRRYPFFQL